MTITLWYQGPFQDILLLLRCQNLANKPIEQLFTNYTATMNETKLC
jgi:hypothetical protein